MEYDFDQLIERRGTDSTKWGLYPEDVIPMWVADMDFKSAQPIIQAIHQRVDHGIFGYCRLSAPLKSAIKERLWNLYRWEIHGDEIVFLPGIVSGLNVAIQGYAAPGDGILAQPPVYFHFIRDPAHHGRMVDDPPLIRNGNTYEIDFERFERSITNRTRVFILCNPHNPVGRVFTRTELEKLAEICLRHGLIICSDEIHCDLLYAGYRHIPIATLGPEVADRTVILMAPSKTYNVAGLSCGYAIIKNEALRRAWLKTSFGIVPGVDITGYTAALAALTEGQEWLSQLLVYLQGNRDFLQQYIRERIPAIQVCKMEATYLAWLDCKETGIRGNPAEFFLKEARVALSNGRDFGTQGEGFVRLNFACPRKRLAEALDRMARAINGI